jgi:hypothetical protein
MFFSIENLRANIAEPLEKPWEFKPTMPPPYDEGKEAMSRWEIDTGTQHAFVSGFEGLSPDVRVTSGDNPPFKMHCLIVDYDAKLPDNPAKYVVEKAPCDFRPTYLVETGSGNARLIWEFEKPFLYTGEAHMKEFMKLLSKKLKLSSWLPGMDTKAYRAPHQYYEIGKSWVKLDKGAPLKSSMLELWLIKSASKISFTDKEGLSYKIPIEDIAKEVDLRYPGRWTGMFALGARGLRFWDPSADNVTASVVTEEGMLCFTGPKPFMSWKDIFGQAFVEDYEADYISGVINKSAYDGNAFWIEETDEGTWIDFSKEDFAQDLRCKGYSGKRTGSQTASEIDRIENTIKKTRRVDKALPFLFFPKGRIRYEGKHYLNTATTEVTKPAPPCTASKMTFLDGRKHFPFIYKLLRTMFSEQENDETGTEQLTALLAWLKFFYCNSLENTPRPGHTIVLAGVAGKGKTLFSKRIIGGLMGGAADASSHLVDGDRWTERLVDSPVMRIDDSLANSDHKSQMQFSARLKKYTANSEMIYDQKYRKAAATPWFGRIVITCNLDSESLRILPDMDISSKDKISLFRTSDNVMNFPDWGTITKTLNKELPNFARFLIDWDIPEEWVAHEARFGVKAYHHPELFEESRQQGQGTLLELLHGFLQEYKEANPEKERWSGNATALHADLSAYNPEVTKEFQNKALSMQLGRLSKNGYRLKKRKERLTGINIWEIEYDITNLGGSYE